MAAMPDAPRSRLIPLKAAAGEDYFNVGEYTLRRMVWAREVDFVQRKKGAPIFFTEQFLADWRERNTHKAREGPPTRRRRRRREATTTTTA